MRHAIRPFVGAGLFALTVGLVPATQSAQAQTAPGLYIPPAARPAVRPSVSRGMVSNNPLGRTTPLPSAKARRIKRPLYYGYSAARREVDVYKPWLKPD